MDKQISIDLLNEAVADELMAVHQYMYWHFHLDDQGFGPLSGLLRRIAIDEMMHIEQLAERILFLKGDVNMVAAGPVQQVTEPEEILKCAAQMEHDAAKLYNESAKKCAENSDAASKQMFEAMVTDEEGHFDIFDKQMDNIKRFGPSYLALQSFNAGGPEAAAE